MQLLILASLLWLLTLIPWSLTWISAAVTIAYLLLISLIIGRRFAPLRYWLFRLTFGLLITLSVIMVSATAFFYVWSLQSLALKLSGFLPLLIALLPTKQRQESIDHEPYRWWLLVLNFFHEVGGLILFWLVAHRATIEPIQSPWLLLPPTVWILYATLSCLILVIIVQEKISLSARLLSLSWHALLSFSLVTLFFPIGFGFDPFIHQASEKIILLTGTLLPKPFYYIGQYGLVVWLQTSTHIPLTYLDRWLLPALAAVMLPSITYGAFRNVFRSDRRALTIVTMALLFLPYGYLIQTTPQGLALLWSYLIIILSLLFVHRQRIPHWMLILLTLAVLSLHPLAGIPMLLYTVTLIVYQRSWESGNILRWIRLLLYGFLTLLAALAMPLVFALQSRLSQLNPSKISLEQLNDATWWSWPGYIRFIRWEDLFYFFNLNAYWLLATLAFVGCWYVIKQKRIGYFMHFIVTYGVLIINYILLSIFVHFDFLLPYERMSYPERILTLSYFFLWPLALIALYLIAKRILRFPIILKAIIVIMVSVVMTISWYLSYPRFDFYSQNKGFNTSVYDQDAVRWIDQSAQKQAYVVLANQSVSAAAIEAFGFEPYYGTNYRYPIPTGGPLYQSYLDVVYNRKGIANVLTDVKSLTGVSNVYIVINDYWSGFEDIVQRLKASAGATTSLSNGRIYIFYFHTQD